MKFTRIALLAGFTLVTQLGVGQTGSATKPAATPPMGWNSWDSYGLTITEEQFRANVQVQASKLKSFGWNYAVIDEGWFFFNPEERPHAAMLHYAIDGYGRYVPVPARFPSAAQSTPAAPAPPPPAPSASGEAKLAATVAPASFKALADYVHSQGLKFGIHIVRGIPRASVERNLPIADSAFHAIDAADTSDACPWDPTNWGVKNNPAGQAWYDSLLAQYAGWGVDLIKVDCIADHPYKIDEIRMLRKAMDRAGRPMVLSLSPGPTSLEHAAEVAETANMWRISDDLWDYWTNPKPFPRSLLSQFDTTAAWAQYAKPGNWPDADMLCFGELRPVPGEGKPRTTRFTRVEQQTMLTLWSMARSPLILGANLTLMDDELLKLLTNADVIRIDQTATASRMVLHSGGMVAWTADLPADSPNGSIALALFNTGDSQIVVNSSFEAYGIEPALYRIHDVWGGKNVTKQKSIQNLTLEPHASALWILKK